jgi:hypothetical protein
LDGCDEKMKEYIKKAKTKYGGDRDELEEEVKRLMKVSKGAGMKDDLKGWFETRVFILQQMILNGSTEEEL